jgi:phage recombination protein Bet
MNEIMSIDSTVNDLVSLSDIPKEQKARELDKNYIAMLVRNNPTLDKRDFIEFITKCQLTGADPRMNQIYLIVHNAWNSQKRVSEPKGTTVFSYQFFVSRAQQTGQLEGWGVDTVKEPYFDVISELERSSLTAICWVKRVGMEKMVYRARFWEFAKTDKDGKLIGNWKASPYLMLEKCAVANALRWAFPETLGNCYIQEEMEKVTGGYQQSYPQTVNKKEPAKIEAPAATPQLPIDELKKEIVDFLNSRPADWFEVIQRNKEVMLDVVGSSKDIATVKDLYQKTIDYDSKYQQSFSSQHEVNNGIN